MANWGAAMAESRLMQVLLVDHDAVNRYTARMALHRVGYILSEAANADEALALYQGRHFDLVLSEERLPEPDGIELLRRIKAVDQDAVVILMTSEPTVESAVSALRFGAQDYLVKPCSSEEMLESISRGIQRAMRRMARRRMLDAIQRNVEELARSEKPDPIHTDAAGREPFAPRKRDRRPAKSGPVQLGPLSLVPGRYQIAIAEREIGLTPTEFDLLLYLAAHRDRVVACSELVHEVRGYQTDEPEAREVIRPHVSNLRRKLGELGDYGKLVVNVRGIGYRLGDLSDA